MTGSIGVVVLNSRPRDQSAELSGLLEAAGFEVVEAAAIATVPAWDRLELLDVRRDLLAGAFDWVVLPGQNAGRLLIEYLGQVRVVCGAASARALGLTPTIALDRFSASAALEVLGTLVQPDQRILVPRAAEGQPDLIDGLVALRARVHAPIAYRTVAVEPSRLVESATRLRNGEVHVVTVCSPSALHSLLAALGRETLTAGKLVCLGETTAQAARQAGLHVDGVAEKTTMGSLVEAVRAATIPPSAPAATSGSALPLPPGVAAGELCTGGSALGPSRGRGEGCSGAEATEAREVVA